MDLPHSSLGDSVAVVHSRMNSPEIFESEVITIFFNVASLFSAITGIRSTPARCDQLIFSPASAKYPHIGALSFSKESFV